VESNRKGREGKGNRRRETGDGGKGGRMAEEFKRILQFSISYLPFSRLRFPFLPFILPF